MQAVKRLVNKRGTQRRRLETLVRNSHKEREIPNISLVKKTLSRWVWWELKKKRKNLNLKLLREVHMSNLVGSTKILISLKIQIREALQRHKVPTKLLMLWVDSPLRALHKMTLSTLTIMWTTIPIKTMLRCCLKILGAVSWIMRAVWPHMGMTIQKNSGI